MARVQRNNRRERNGSRDRERARIDRMRAAQNRRIFVPDGPKKNIVEDAYNAAIRGNLDKLKEAMAKMQQEKIDVNCQSPEGRSLAHFAAMSGKPEILRFVQQEGVDIHVRDFNGNTIAHAASRFGGSTIFGNISSGSLTYDMIRTMEELGIDMTAKNAEGQTPLDIIAPLTASNVRILHGSKYDVRTIHNEETGEKISVFYYSQPEDETLRAVTYLSEKQGEKNAVVCVNDTLEEDVLKKPDIAERNSTLRERLVRLQESKTDANSDNINPLIQQNTR